MIYSLLNKLDALAEPIGDFVFSIILLVLILFLFINFLNLKDKKASK